MVPPATENPATRSQTGPADDLTFLSLSDEKSTVPGVVTLAELPVGETEGSSQNQSGK